MLQIKKYVFLEENLTGSSYIPLTLILSGSIMTPERALERLKEGNKRFISCSTHYNIDLPESRTSLIHGQRPFATILGCSDARVPVELIFDQGFDDLFIIRVAGNVIGQNELGSLLYATLHLHTPLIVVLGHTYCSAVTAALASQEERIKEPEPIQHLLGQIDPAVQDLDHSLPLPERMMRGIEANVRRSVNILATNNVMQPLVKNKNLYIVGAVYDLETGKVKFRESDFLA